jgi:transcriptional regulator with XRE-family HTH domain
MLHQSFQDKLREVRQSLGLTQAEVAQRLKVRQPTYADMETGPNPPNLATIEKIAKVLGVDPRIFFSEEPTPA